MKNFQDNRPMSGQSFGAAMFALTAVSMAAFALTVPATFGPRQMATQQTAYFRINVVATTTGISANGITCVAAVTGGANCSVKVGALPYNAYVVRAYQQIITSFNSTTTDTLGLGTTTAGVNLVAAQSVHGAAGGSTVLTVVAANAGITVTGNGIASTGANGGFDLYVNFTYTGGNIATAGQAILVLEYFAPNDGTCVDVPLGSTAV
jgi:hypothetical protein